MPDSAPYGQHLLPWSLVKDEALIPEVHGQRSAVLDRDTLWGELRKEIEEADLPSVVISSEEFDILDRAAIDDLAEQLQAYDIVPIIFLRNLSDLVESGYRTAVVVSGFPEDITFFFGNHRTRMDYAQLMQDWRGASSNGQLIVASYDDPHLSADIVLTFLRLIGLDANAVEPIRLPRQNESALAFVVEIARFLRSRSASESEISSWLHTVSRMPFASEVNKRYTLLPDALRGSLDQRYLQQLGAIASNPELASQIYGQLVLPPQHPGRVCIHNTKEALLAFTQEIELLRTGG
ncbi:MAG: hypothetical protein SGI91_02640 [Alphaproteobacteria bacterium]|nr:hypothetical protein [Alphaproteobacteria bacterium]